MSSVETALDSRGAGHESEDQLATSLLRWMLSFGWSGSVKPTDAGGFDVEVGLRRVNAVADCEIEAASCDIRRWRQRHPTDRRISVSLVLRDGRGVITQMLYRAVP